MVEYIKEVIPIANRKKGVVTEVLMIPLKNQEVRGDTISFIYNEVVNHIPNYKLGKSQILSTVISEDSVTVTIKY